ncbi:hypothetical protein FLGE108171_14600 [Flavobacterium gelidilacus]|uniref:hypothetical protein n=1 Tax=Flavobacterium gelidilacus TaxID=206041 RepID=UPI000409ED65|nr:hypothetical protein [Flavobacterium gelidilacus]
MKNIFTFFVLIFITTTVKAQIGSTKSKIIQENKNYSIEKTDDGTDYISFVVEFENYNQQVACYLTEKEANKEQLCFRVLMIEPSSETNNWIRFFNEQNFVKLAGMTWKDYEHSIVYEVVVKDGNCLVHKYYDTKL